MADPKKSPPPPAKTLKETAQIAGAASQKASANTDPECPDCAEKAELQAVILYPALGTPYIAPAAEKRIRLFLIVENKCIKEFGINGREAPYAWHYINTHLRIMPFKEASKTSADLKGKKLYASEGAAKAGIKVWYKGTYGSEAPNGKGLGWQNRLIDHDGHILANVRESAIKLYVGNTLADGSFLQAAFPSKDQVSDTTNQPLPHLFEIELEFPGLRVVPAPDAMYTLAWMVNCVYKKEPDAFKGTVTHWEHQDKLVYDFFQQMKRNRQHFAEPFAFDLEKLKPDAWPKQQEDELHRIKPYHPFIFKAGKSRLDLGHLTDIHVSSRQFALARSDAQVIEGQEKSPGGILGEKVVNCLASCKDLFDQFQSGPNKAGALFITGDLLDFNRNLDPSQVPGKTPMEQWPCYNLASRLDVIDDKTNAPHYPRGLDDMLMYSLIRRAYENKLPVFMTTGNHEAYDEPYGISPRTNGYARKRAANPSARAVLPGGPKSVAKGTQPWKSQENLDPNEDGSKANAGIPADHNLTIYEACLIYGPTFAQIMQSWNYMPDNYDWFFTLFTPLADFSVPYGDQLITGLEWGDEERMVQVGTEISLLPRSIKAISEIQLALLRHAIGRKAAQHLVFSHFTAVNYGQGKPYCEADNWDLPKTSDKLTSGTFEQARETFFQWIENKDISAHFSGHSHRSGGYEVAVRPGKAYGKNLHVLAAHDPAKQNKKGNPQLWVSSCGGGIGIQNLKGELRGWNLMPPSGSFIDGTNCGVRTVAARNIKPRFCVALDYLQCHEGQQVIQWWLTPAESGRPAQLVMAANHVAQATPFIDSVTFHAWNKKANDFDPLPLPVSLDGTRSNGTLIYRCPVENPAAFLRTLTASSITFVEVTFNDELAQVTDPVSGAKLYDQFNFKDPWIFRVAVEYGGGIQMVKFHPKGGVPDWDWLRNTNKARYPDSSAITKDRTPGR